MKKLLLSLAAGAALTVTAFAQNFEGTITWSLKYDMAGAMGQQMQQAQQMMNDPAMLAQMQAAMNNPTMQQMMAQNPQIKAMMDNMGRGAAGSAAGGGMNGIMPKGVTVKIKGNSSLSVIEGGMTAGEVLTLADKNVAYLIDRPSRTYSTVNQGNAAAMAPAGRYKITKTNETTTILGYSATKTLVEETTGRGQATTYTIWSTNAIAGANSKQFSQLKLTQNGDSSFMSAIDGVPMRLEITAPEMKMTMEVTAVKKEAIADSVFALPAGFTEQKIPQM